MSGTLGKAFHYIRTGNTKFLFQYAKNKGFKGTMQLVYDGIKEAMTLDTFYETLLHDIREFRHAYPYSPRKAALYLIWWNFSSLFKDVSKSRSDSFTLDKDHLNIMILPNGGLGDYLMNANYVYHLKKRFEHLNLHIDVVAKEKFLGPTKEVFENDENIIDGIYPNEHRTEIDKYDAAIDISRYPVFIHYDHERIVSIAPEFIEYIAMCERFRGENWDIIMNRPYFDGEAGRLCISMNKHRIQQSDINGFFGMTQEFKYPMRMPDEGAILKKFDLPERYITVHRGCDTDYSNKSIKMWPQQKYNDLIRLIKAKYPDIAIVQLGVSHKRCETFENIDINLVEMTDIADLKVILKHSLMHVDGEGGMAHLRHAVKGGPSVIMFGPTPLELYGYAENENIRGDGCDQWCEWKVKNWMDRCALGYEDSPCLESIKLDTVMESVAKILDGVS